MFLVKWLNINEIKLCKITNSLKSAMKKPYVVHLAEKINTVCIFKIKLQSEWYN